MDTQEVKVLIEQIEKLRQEKGSVLVAIDGRCASGKTTLTKKLRNLLDCNIIHMDHFFLRPEQRTPARLQQSGGNVDYERFLSEVLLPLREKRDFSYRPYNCHSQSMSEEIEVMNKEINIVEGSYSCHPELWDFYDIRVFLTIDSTEQLRRIHLRNGEKGAKIFAERWIPMEERYFEEYEIQQRCDIIWENQ